LRPLFLKLNLAGIIIHKGALRMRLLLIEENLPLWDSIIQLLADELDDAQASVDRSKILVLFLTEKDLFEDREELKARGKDDINQPVPEAELKGRIKDLLKENGRKRKNKIIQYRGIQLLGKEHGVLIDGNSIKLTSKQYRLLEYLIKNKGAILTKEQIYDYIWGFDSETTIAIVEVFIHHLRKKLQPFGYHSDIKTIRGVGYMLKEE
jgi:two-component system, OmpR family, response regulator CiaR